MDGAVELFCCGSLLFRHTASHPALFLGRGSETIRMFRGNFDISDRISERIALVYSGQVAENGNQVLLFTHPCMQGEFRLTGEEQNGMLHLSASCNDPSFNRLWHRLVAV